MDTALQRPSAYRHPAGRIVRIETPISVVYLAGRFAYKIKKPVKLDFVDFSHLAARQYYCEEELRLNRRLARRLYLGVIPIVAIGRRYQVGARGHAVDYAVRMKRFDEHEVFASLLANDKLSHLEMDRLATRLLEFHRHAAKKLPQRTLGSAALVRSQIEAVLASLERESSAQDASSVLAAVRAWCRKTLDQLAEHFAVRNAGGFVRECHGDLHLSNILRQGKQAVMFDCIEFSTALRWIDVASDLSFLLMDLEAHGRSDLATRLLNRSLELGGDYAGLAAMRFYIVYRALVRGLVATLAAKRSSRLSGHADSAPYLALAARKVLAPHPALLLLHGYSGSGKTVASQALAPLIGAICLSSDVERKRNQVFRPPDSSALPAAAYTPTEIDANYDKLLELVSLVLQAAYSAIVDASFLKQAHRTRFIELAQSRSIPCFILDLHANPAHLAKRIRLRASDVRQLSDADENVLAMQYANADALSGEECMRTLTFDTDVAPESMQQAAYWQTLLDRLPAPDRA